jgi:hypothetical protein
MEKRSYEVRPRHRVHRYAAGLRIDQPCARGLADGRELYVEFEYPDAEITPWLAKNVVPMLGTEKVSLKQAAAMIRELVGGSRFDQPECWAYYAAYDWYWSCRVFGGFIELPRHYPHRIRDLAHFQQDLPNISGPEHHALHDAHSVLHAMIYEVLPEPN